MVRGVRYHGLTIGQLGRLAACERKEQGLEIRVGLSRQDIAEVLEVEPTQAGRFIREMVNLGWMYSSWRPERRGRKGECSTYRTTPVWHDVSTALREDGVLPDVCEWDGCTDPALPFRYRERFWCREHLQEVHCIGCTRTDADGQCLKECGREVSDEHAT